MSSMSRDDRNNLLFVLAVILFAFAGSIYCVMSTGAFEDPPAARSTEVGPIMLPRVVACADCSMA